MSYSLYLQGFRDGDAADLNADVVRQVIGPYAVSCVSGGYSLVVPDGGTAELYGYPEEDKCSGISISHFSSGDVLKVFVKLMLLLDAVILLPEGLALIGGEHKRNDLPHDLQGAAIVINNGLDAERIIAEL